MSLSVRVESTLSAEVLDLVRRTPVGSPGGVVLRDIEPDLSRVEGATWISAWRGDRVVGAYAVVPRPWGWWRCHFTVPGGDAEVGQRLVAEVHDRWSTRLEGGKVLAGSVERSNQRLVDLLSRAGYRHVGELGFVFLTRRRATEVHAAQVDDLPILRARLDQRTVRWGPTVTSPQGWVVLRRRGRVLAGARLCGLRWWIDQLGPGSRLTLPLLRALGVSLRPVRMVSAHHVFGEVDHVAELLQGALVSHEAAAVMVGLDVADPRWPAVESLPRGAVGQVVGAQRSLILATGPVPSPIDWEPAFAA